MGLSRKRAQTASSERPAMCLMRCSPTMRRVGSPGRPRPSRESGPKAVAKRSRRSGQRAAPGDGDDRRGSRAPSGRVRAGQAAKIWAESAGSSAATRRQNHAARQASTGLGFCKVFARCGQGPCKRGYLQIPRSQAFPRRSGFFTGDELWPGSGATGGHLPCVRCERGCRSPRRGGERDPRSGVNGRPSDPPPSPLRCRVRGSNPRLPD
jgi:hypothetical protein